jgi:hypothetical protein
VLIFLGWNSYITKPGMRNSVNIEIYDEEGSAVYEQPGGTGFRDDESTAEDIRMFQELGRSEDVLPDTRLYIYLPETRVDGQ